MELNSKIPFLRGGNDPSKFLSGDGSWKEISENSFIKLCDINDDVYGIKYTTPENIKELLIVFQKGSMFSDCYILKDLFNIDYNYGNSLNLLRANVPSTGSNETNNYIAELIILLYKITLIRTDINGDRNNDGKCISFTLESIYTSNIIFFNSNSASTANNEALKYGNQKKKIGSNNYGAVYYKM